MMMKSVNQLVIDGLTQERREDIFRDELDNGIIVDTCCPTDTARWETGIRQNDEWYIAEDYDSRSEAEEGHRKWVEAMLKNPNLDLTALDEEFLEKWLAHATTQV